MLEYEACGVPGAGIYAESVGASGASGYSLFIYDEALKARLVSIGVFDRTGAYMKLVRES